jgi:hypothetical protein
MGPVSGTISGTTVIDHGAQIPRWSPLEIVGLVTGAASALTGILLTPPGSSVDAGRARAGYVLELTGAALVLGISAERALRTYIAERGHAHALAAISENPTARGQRYVNGRLLILVGRHVGHDAHAEAAAHAKKIRAGGGFARIVKVHSFDYKVYGLG